MTDIKKRIIGVDGTTFVNVALFKDAVLYALKTDPDLIVIVPPNQFISIMEKAVLDAVDRIFGSGISFMVLLACDKHLAPANTLWSDCKAE